MQYQQRHWISNSDDGWVSTNRDVAYCILWAFQLEGYKGKMNQADRRLCSGAQAPVTASLFLTPLIFLFGSLVDFSPSFFCFMLSNEEVDFFFFFAGRGEKGERKRRKARRRRAKKLKAKRAKREEKQKGANRPRIPQS